MSSMTSITSSSTSHVHRRAMANRVTLRSLAATGCSMALFLLLLFVVPYAAIGYKKFLKGLILGAMLMKHNNQDEHHYFYPTYHHGHGGYDDYGHY